MDIGERAECTGSIFQLAKEQDVNPKFRGLVATWDR
jgi:hypothetical protein